MSNYKNPCSGVTGPCFKSSKVVHSMNYDKFNEAYHEWSDDHFIQCAIAAQDVLDGEQIYLIKENRPFSELNVLNSYQGIGPDDYGFKLAKIHTNGGMRPCKILKSDAARNVFDVVYYLKEGDIENPAHPGSSILVTRKDVPAAAIRFLNKPFTSDLFSPTSFRHYIGIPDEIMPPLWKDVNK